MCHSVVTATMTEDGKVWEHTMKFLSKQSNYTPSCLYFDTSSRIYTEEKGKHNIVGVCYTII